ncbi:uncharacterized protein SCHCODRAFT_02629412 [Schizophyllum commune H4-8]|uniref:uncharacterized protein n=1 Tax=Schizophyllum commune (strain H4-8 / FGSC 9210) TaxID=578458 RepID=UPI00215F1AEB|nr:uncharacterized protein SCHCODRAFT_02629412 [Schizophyllum commune H4-8]KAI5891556.1 hypothetical protein SCHCODRAFT_02629412 [Schizophyllum commune H4-8]
MPLLGKTKKSELRPVDDSHFTELEKEEKSSWFIRMITEVSFRYSVLTGARPSRECDNNASYWVSP